MNLSLANHTNQIKQIGLKELGQVLKSLILIIEKEKHLSMRVI